MNSPPRPSRFRGSFQFLPGAPFTGPRFEVSPEPHPRPAWSPVRSLTILLLFSQIQKLMPQLSLPPCSRSWLRNRCLLKILLDKSLRLGYCKVDESTPPR
jgi:hypothetical protein